MSDTAIKIGTYGNISDGLVSLYPGDTRFDIRFPGIPTEITYRLPEGMSFGYDLFYEYSKALEQQYDEIGERYGLDALKKVRGVVSKTLFPRDKEDALDDEIKAELGEIIEHLTTLFKAKMLEYVHTKHDAEVKRMEQNLEKAKAQLALVLKNGPEGIQYDKNNDD